MPTIKDYKSQGAFLHMAPFIGVALGAVLAWYVGARIDPDKSVTPAEWAIRLFSILTATVMWAVVTSWAQKKEMYGGGLVDMCDSQDRRLNVIRLIYLFFLILSAVALGSKDFTLFWYVAPLLLLSVVSEIGWRRPALILGC
ncbi:hypothetical protein [Stutzerimonas nitrititolerans]|uniref:hypothetical protein n=1 Tax=Stutzerimonas nitrititolerans TaxID=2482751 RepID=UPI0028983A2F|nr:hypothetical protein [Stutzerimonas nitrititolerans]